MKPLPKIVDRILEAFSEHQTFCVVGHIRPDGDCVGSQLAVTLALQQLGKDVTCWNEDPCPAKLAFMDPKGLFQRPEPGREFDCVVATDAASFERLGRVGELVGARKVLVNIDHHASNTRFGDLNWVSVEEPSSGELIYKLIRHAGWKLSRQMANCLFTAISTDTGSFQYPSTTPDTFAVAGELVELGADLGGICQEVYHSFPLSRVRLVQHMFRTFKLTHRNQIGYFWLRARDYARTGADTAESEGLIDHIRAIEPVVVACVFEEVEPDLIRLSLRSKREDLDVNRIASEFGGGGHRAAAGARVRGTPASVQRRVLRAIKRALEQNR